MTWYYGLILAVCLLPAAAWLQLVIHELSHWAFGAWFEERRLVGIWVFPHWCAQGVEKPVRWWLLGRKKPARAWFNKGPDWGVFFYLGRCWTRGPEPYLKHSPRAIAPMWAGLAVMVTFGIPCIWFWPAFAPFSFYGLLHVLDFWKDYLWGEERSDGKRWRYGKKEKS